MNRGLAIVTVAALFIAGVAAGALGMHLYYDRRLDGPGGRPIMGHRHFGRRLHQVLNLTDEQERAIDGILRRTREQAQDLRRELQPRVRDLIDRAHGEIADLLTPEQRKTFEELVEQYGRRAEHYLLGPPPGGGRHFGGHGPPPGGGPWPGPPPPAPPPPDTPAPQD